MNRTEQFLVMAATARQLEEVHRKSPYLDQYMHAADFIEARLMSNPAGIASTIEAEYDHTNISRVSKAALYVGNFPQQAFVQYSFQALALRDVYGFLFNADIALGIGLVSGGIVAIDSQTQYSLEEVVMGTSANLDLAGVEFKTTDAIEAYLSIADITTRNPLLVEDNGNKKRLADPTGFEATDWLVEFFKQELGKPPHERLHYVYRMEEPDFLIRGIEMAGRLYKQAYSVAESTSSGNT